MWVIKAAGIPNANFNILARMNGPSLIRNFEFLDERDIQATNKAKDAKKEIRNTKDEAAAPVAGQVTASTTAQAEKTTIDVEAKTKS